MFCLFLPHVNLGEGPGLSASPYCGGTFAFGEGRKTAFCLQNTPLGYCKVGRFFSTASVVRKPPPPKGLSGTLEVQQMKVSQKTIFMVRLCGLLAAVLLVLAAWAEPMPTIRGPSCVFAWPIRALPGIIRPRLLRNSVIWWPEVRPSHQGTHFPQRRAGQRCGHDQGGPERRAGNGREFKPQPDAVCSLPHGLRSAVHHFHRASGEIVRRAGYG